MQIKFNTHPVVPAFKAQLSNDAQTQKAFFRLQAENPVDTFILANAIKKAKANDVISLRLFTDNTLYLENLSYPPKHSAISYSICLKNDCFSNRPEHGELQGAFDLELTNGNTLADYITTKDLALKETVKNNKHKIHKLAIENNRIMGHCKEKLSKMKSSLGLSDF